MESLVKIFRSLDLKDQLKALGYDLSIDPKAYEKWQLMCLLTPQQLEELSGNIEFKKKLHEKQLATYGQGPTSLYTSPFDVDSVIRGRK